MGKEQEGALTSNLRPVSLARVRQVPVALLIATCIAAATTSFASFQFLDVLVASFKF